MIADKPGVDRIGQQKPACVGRFQKSWITGKAGSTLQKKDYQPIVARTNRFSGIPGSYVEYVQKLGHEALGIYS